MIKLVKIIPIQNIQKEQKQNKQTTKPSFEEFFLKALANWEGEINGKSKV